MTFRDRTHARLQKQRGRAINAGMSSPRRLLNPNRAAQVPMAAAAAPAPAPVLVQTVENLVLYPSSEMLGVGDDTRTHWARVMMLARAQEAFKYSAGHGRARQGS